MYRWRIRALAIPSEPIRQDALYVLEHKRTHLHGAALFSILPRRRSHELVRLLVAYELIWDFLDNVNERASYAGPDNGRQLHLAVAEAVDPSAAISNYYSRHPWRDDGGYLRTLVETCRQSCNTLPCFPLVSERVLHDAHRAQVLALNHHPDPGRRELALITWAAREFPGQQDAAWWELSGAASAPLAIHALLALAAEPSCTESEIASIHDAYCPWVCALTTMLDSYVDQLEDSESGDHSYLAHYPSADLAQVSIQALVVRSVMEARSLPNGQKHAVIATAMIAMYLSKDAARTNQLQPGTEAFIRAGGSLTKLLLPILRVWRIAYAQRSA